MLPPIEKKFSFAHPPSTVYAAWVSSGTVIAPATAMDIDPRVGGRYRLIMDTPEFSTRNDGVFRVVEPEERLTYSWQWQGDNECTEIDVRFAGTAEGTEVRIVHSGFISEESRANHDAGWDSYADGLAAFLAGAD